VLAVDAMEEAVVLARSKGVEAICADIHQWAPDEVWPVVYMDGLLGHLYEPDRGLQPVLERVRSWLSSAGPRAALVASNDTPRDGGQTQPAPGVDGFSWLSAAYMRNQAREAGFEDAVAEEFRYERPLSGERVRGIVIGHVTR